MKSASALSRGILCRPESVRALTLSVALVLTSFIHAAVAPAQLDAARELYNAQKNAEAQEAFQAIVAQDPQNADAYRHLGYLALRRKQPDAALPLFEKAVALEPKNGLNHLGLGDAFGNQAQNASIFRQLGLAKKCLAAYQRAVELAPDDVNCRNSLFEYYRNAPGFAGGGHDKAVEQATVMVKLDPARGHYAYATLYAGEKKFPEAFAAYEQSVQLAPDNFYVTYQLGKLADTTGQHLALGLTALRHCLELPPLDRYGGPGHAAVHWRIGNILQQQGDLTGARAAYQASLQVDPKFPNAAEALKKMPNAP